jgi:hypothetical protein
LITGGAISRACPEVLAAGAGAAWAEVAAILILTVSAARIKTGNFFIS